MNDIDEMDFIGWLKVKAFELNAEQKPKKVFIDEIF